MDSIFLSVIIPCYNERKNLERGVLKDVSDYLKKQEYKSEVIISDDGSPDEETKVIARKEAEKYGFVFLENEHGGKPYAILCGAQKARGEISVFLDMDMSTPLREIEKLLPFYKKNYDIVIGSRGSSRKNTPLFRLLASTVFRTFRRIILLRGIVDTQCGFKSAKTSIAKEILPKLDVVKNVAGKTSGWKVTSYDVEFLYIAEKRGYKIAEVPVEWEQRDLDMATKQSSDKGKFVKESIDMLFELWRVKTNDLRGYYK